MPPWDLKAYPAVRLAFPAVLGHSPRAGGPELDIWMQSSTLIPLRWSEVSQTRPFWALRVPSKFFFFGGCTEPQSGRFLGDMSARSPRGRLLLCSRGSPLGWISSPRGTEPAPGE